MVPKIVAIPTVANKTDSTEIMGIIRSMVESGHNAFECKKMQLANGEGSDIYFHSLTFWKIEEQEEE